MKMSASNHYASTDRYSFVDVTEVDELRPGERIFVETDFKTIVVINIAGKIYAVEDSLQP